MLTGECDSIFKFKILAIEDIFELYNHFNHEIYYNGVTIPSYITHYKEKTEPLKVSNQKHDFMVKLVKNNDGGRHILADTIEETKQLFNLDFVCHNQSGVNQLSDFRKFFKQPLMSYLIKIETLLLIGGKLLNKTCYKLSKSYPFSNCLNINTKYMKFGDLRISSLPLETRLCFNIIVYSGTGESLTIGSAYMNLFNSNGELVQGEVEVSLWPFYSVDTKIVCNNDYNGYIKCDLQERTEINKEVDRKSQNNFMNFDIFKSPDHSENLENHNKDPNSKNKPSEFNDLENESEDKHSHGGKHLYGKKCKIYLQFEKFSNKMVYSLRDEKTMSALGHIPQQSIFEKMNEQALNNNKKGSSSMDSEDLIHIQQLLSSNPVEMKLSLDDKQVILRCREQLKHISSALSIFLQAIDWGDPEQVKIVLEILPKWAEPTIDEAVMLLDSRFPNEWCRYYVVTLLEKSSDKTLKIYLLQLVMALLYEPMMYNPLTEHL